MSPETPNEWLKNVVEQAHDEVESAKSESVQALKSYDINAAARYKKIYQLIIELEQTAGPAISSHVDGKQFDGATRLQYLVQKLGQELSQYKPELTANSKKDREMLVLEGFYRKLLEAAEVYGIEVNPEDQKP